MSEEHTPALKSCPFCGDDDPYPIKHFWHCVTCRQCGAEVRAEGDDDGETTEAEAIAAWNTRTPDPAVAGLVEALEIAVACGIPSRVALYDEEAVDGWEWQHPDGREWSEIGDHNDPPPAHPIISEALATWIAQ